MNCWFWLLALVLGVISVTALLAFIDAVADTLKRDITKVYGMLYGFREEYYEKLYFDSINRYESLDAEYAKYREGRESCGKAKRTTK